MGTIKMHQHVCSLALCPANGLISHHFGLGHKL
ncbi:protein of unknown function [Magnetospirillum sp. XM-1]|nr:protein of unknown function [Magnetospirillum sp. XM-1]